MNRHVYARVWLYLGGLNALTALNIQIQSQGGLLFSGGYLLEKRQIIACYFGTILIATVLSAVCWCGIFHIAEAGAVPWPKRLPVPGENDKEPISGRGWKAGAYQAFFVFVFTVLPIISLIHFNGKVWKHGAVWSDVKDAAINAVPVKCMFVVADADCDTTKLEVIRPRAPGDRYWLAENVTDPKHWRNPQAEKFYITSSDNRKLQYVPHDLSDGCRENSEKCRGVQWLHPWSIIMMWAFTALGIGSAGTFFFHLVRRRDQLDSEART